MLIACVLALLTQTKPGPMDGFRTNFASVRASVQFQCDYYSADGLSGVSDRLKEYSNWPGPSGKPGHVAEGMWEYDGASEHYLLRITGGTLRDPSGQSGPLAQREAICDRQTFAFQPLTSTKSGSAIYVHTNLDRFPFILLGPFTWNLMIRLDQEIEVDFRNARVERHTGLRGPHLTEVEVYEKKSGDIRIRDEIWYDPAVGYLPRFLRKIAHGIEKGRSLASVYEFYLMDAQLCSAGGFVPSEWYVHQYHVEDFSSRYPDYNHQTRLAPTDNATLIHFKAVKQEDRKTTVRMEEMEGIERIYAPGGSLDLKGSYKSMTLGELKSLLGKLLKPKPLSKRAIVASIDEAEKHEFDNAPQHSSWLPYMIAAFVAVLVVAAVAWRWAKVMLVLVALIAIAGCGHRSVARLTVAFAPSRLLCEPAQSIPHLSLMVRNVGNQTLRLLGVDAGCSCRHVNPSDFPATLKPDASLRLRIELRGLPASTPQNVAFTFTTDQGTLVAPSVLYALPKHQLDPQSVTLAALDEGPDGTEGSFELVHRHSYQPDAPKVDAELMFPTEFIVEKTGQKEGRVDGAPEYAYKETSYKLTLNDRSLGLHRAEIVIRGPDGAKFLDASIVWERLPFLSSTPNRLFLTNHASRAFLRCPDETVELTRVLAAPSGVKAVVSSPRELTVMLTDGIRGVIDGVIEVATTAARRPPLRIPVVHYAPLADRRK